MKSSTKTEDFPYWWRKDNPFSLTKVDLPKKVDVLIIGGGYTGLCASLAVNSLGADALVIDKGNAGEGASTRNGGMFGAHPRLSWEKIKSVFGKTVADNVFEEAPQALNFVKNIIDENKIDCDFVNSGRIQLAWTKEHFSRQKKMADNISKKSAVKIELLEKADLSRYIATEKYYGGLHFPEHCSLDPKKFHNGLLAAAMNAGVKLKNDCEAKKISREGKYYRVALSNNMIITTSKIIMATNGYAGINFPWFFRRVFPIPSYLITTEELSESFMKNLLPGNKMMVETRSTHSYFRSSPDNKRIIFGGRASMINIPHEKAKKRLQKTMSEIWPDTMGVGITNMWSGNTGFTFNQLPHVGRVDDIYYAMGFSGSGTVLAPYLGYKVGYQAFGDRRGETAYNFTKLRTNPFHLWSKPHFLKLVDMWYRLYVDNTERQ